MRRGTTPEHTFTLPFDTSTIAAVRIIYEYNDNEIVVKTKDDCTLDGKDIKVKLSQEDTLKFICNTTIKVQVRILTVDGEAIASDVMTVFVKRLKISLRLPKN